MTTRILGQGVALPAYSITQQEAVAYAKEYFCETETQRRQLPMLYRMSGVKHRHSTLLEAPEGEPDRQVFFEKPVNGHDMGPDISTRMQRYEADAKPLAVEASRQALEEAGVEADEITHVVTVSCSGFTAPGVDVDLIKALELPFTTERVHVGFMGCHGALNGLRTARGFVESDPNARVLLCAVELCSLHYHYGWDPDQIVANALFADGAAAVVLGGSDAGNTGENGSAPWNVSNTGSCLIPDSEDAMTWRIRNNGFVMSLSPRVPDLICAHLHEWMDTWLGKRGLSVETIPTWAIHPGGPRILSASAKALGLENGKLDVSKDILKHYGNMSSPTILFIVRKLRELGAPMPCVGLAFGPGLMAEAVLFE